MLRKAFRLSTSTAKNEHAKAIFHILLALKYTGAHFNAKHWKKWQIGVGKIVGGVQFVIYALLD